MLECLIPPSGAGDEARLDRLVHTKPEVVLRALAEADKGKVYKLGHEYSSEMPLFAHAISSRAFRGR